MTVAALVMAVVTATFSLGIEATFDKTMSDPSVIGGPPYDLGIDRDLVPDAEARRLLDSLPEVEGYLAMYNSGARIGNRGFDLVAYDGDLNEPRWAVREGRMPREAGEAAVSTLLAREFGIDVGDEVTVTTGGFDSPSKPVTVTIVGRYVDFEGEVMTVTRATLNPENQPNDYLINSRPGTDNLQLADKLIQLSGGNLDPEVYTESIKDIRDDWRPVIFGLNGVLFGIAGVNLLSSMLLSIRERRRDFAILKTVGFTPGQVARSVLFSSATLAVVAVAIGLPLGLVATRVMFDVLSSAAGIGTGVGAMPGPLWLAPLVPGAVAVALLGTALPARRAASVRIAEALRYE
jgi:putative ABC transport system permease protein